MSQTPASFENQYITFGHTHVRRSLLAAFKDNRAAHAYLLTGPRGIGKATLARHMALHILSGSWDEEADFKDNPGRLLRMKAGSHGDFLIIEQVEGKDIPVDEVRRLNHFLTQTSMESPFRVVIVDGVESLNRNGANALLKNLEEPHPGVVFFLIAQSTGGLLATLRSRCQHIALSPLDAPTFQSLVRHVEHTTGAPLDPLLLAEAEGSLGRALFLQSEGGVEFLRRCEGLLAGDRSVPLMDFIKTCSASQLDLLAEKVRAFVHHHLLQATGENLENWIALWDKMGEIYERAGRAQLDLASAHLCVFSLLPKGQKS